MRTENLKHFTDKDCVMTVVDILCRKKNPFIFICQSVCKKDLQDEWKNVSGRDKLFKELPHISSSS